MSFCALVSLTLSNKTIFSGWFPFQSRYFHIVIISAEMSCDYSSVICHSYGLTTCWQDRVKRGGALICAILFPLNAILVVIIQWRGVRSVFYMSQSSIGSRSDLACRPYPALEKKSDRVISHIFTKSVPGITSKGLEVATEARGSLFKSK